VTAVKAKAKKKAAPPKVIYTKTEIRDGREFVVSVLAPSHTKASRQTTPGKKRATA
jgi:hypothetical protein